MSDNVSIQQVKAVVKTDRQLQAELLKACENDDLSKVKDFITSGVNPHFGKKELANLEICWYMVLVFMCTVHYFLESHLYLYQH